MRLPNFDDLWDYDHPAESEKRFRELLPQAQQSGDVAYHAQLLTQIARAQGLQRRFDDAHRTLDEAQALITNDMTIAPIRCLLERGRVFNSSRQPEQARQFFLDAWERAVAAEADYYAIDAAHMLGIIEPPEQQLEWNQKALQLAEKSVDPRAQRWSGSLYNNIGWMYHDAGQYDRALEMFEKALRLREAQGETRPIRIARWCVGRALRSLNRIDEALKIQESLLAEYHQSGDTDGYVCEEVGECLLALGRADAPKYFALAYTELSKDSWLAENEPARLQRLRVLAQAQQTN